MNVLKQNYEKWVFAGKPNLSPVRTVMNPLTKEKLINPKLIEEEICYRRRIFGPVEIYQTPKENSSLATPKGKMIILRQQEVTFYLNKSVQIEMESAKNAQLVYGTLFQGQDLIIKQLRNDKKLGIQPECIRGIWFDLMDNDAYRVNTDMIYPQEGYPNKYRYAAKWYDPLFYDRFIEDNFVAGTVLKNIHISKKTFASKPKDLDLKPFSPDGEREYYYQMVVSEGYQEDYDESGLDSEISLKDFSVMEIPGNFQVALDLRNPDSKVLIKKE